MNNYKSVILMHPKKFYNSDQETPMDLAVNRLVKFVDQF